jgi:hypothetical protein
MAVAWKVPAPHGVQVISEVTEAGAEKYLPAAQDADQDTQEFEADSHAVLEAVQVQPVRPVLGLEPVAQVLGQSVPLLEEVAKPVGLNLFGPHMQLVTDVPVPAVMVEDPGQAVQPLAPVLAGVP